MDNSIEILWTFLVDYPEGWGVKRHAHDHYQMYYCTDGEGVMLVDNKDITLKHGDCLIIYPEQMHEIYPIQHGQMRVIDTKFRIHDPALEKQLRTVPQKIVMDDAHFLDIQQQMRNEWLSGAMFAAELTTSLFMQSLILYMRNNNETSTLPPFYIEFRDKSDHLTGLVRTLADYLTTHYLEEISLDQLAQDLCYTKNYLCKIFKRDSGYTISEYINILRIVKAYNLVTSTEKKFTDISSECGYSSVHYFTRTFRKITGMTPSQARDYEANIFNTGLRLHGFFKYRYNVNDNTNSQLQNQ